MSLKQFTGSDSLVSSEQGAMNNETSRHIYDSLKYKVVLIAPEESNHVCNLADCGNRPIYKIDSGVDYMYGCKDCVDQWARETGSI